LHRAGFFVHVVRSCYRVRRAVSKHFGFVAPETMRADLERKDAFDRATNVVLNQS
jgi:hypothetical protein